MMQGSINGQVTLLQVFDILLEDTKNRVGIDRTPATYTCIRQVKDSLAEFIPATYGVSDMAFGQMTNQFISDYEHFLINGQCKKAATAHKHFTYLKQACHRAYKDGLTDKYYHHARQGRLDGSGRDSKYAFRFISHRVSHDTLYI